VEVKSGIRNEFKKGCRRNQRREEGDKENQGWRMLHC